jgi:nitrogen-specific signal transduction histidine kinase
MTLTFGLQVFTFICSILFGIFVLLKNPYKRASVILSVICLLISGWVFCGIVMSIQISSGIDPNITSRISMMIVSLIFDAFIYISLVFPYQESYNNNILTGFNVSCAISIFMALKGLYIREFEIVNHIGIRHFTSAVYFFVLYLISSTIYSLYNLLGKYFKTRSALNKNQLKYIFLGISVGIFFPLVFSLFLPIMGFNELFFIGEIGSIFFIAFTVYAVVKHRLLDIEVIFRKGIIYSVVFCAVIGTYAILAITIGQYLQSITGDGSLFINLISVFIILAGYKPLETFIENATDRIFFKKRYNYQQILNKLLHEIGSAISLNDLLLLIFGVIKDVMRSDRISIYLKDAKGKWEEIIPSEKSTTEAPLFKVIKLDDTMRKHLAEVKEIVLADEIDHRINSQMLPPNIKEKLVHIKDILKEKEISVCVPIHPKNGLIGALNLGDKLSGDIYTYQDMEFMSILAYHISIALENFRLRQQLEHAERLTVLGKLAGSLAHEIRNPITSIKAFFSLVNDDRESEADKKELANLASQEILRVEGLLDNLLNFARPSKPEISSICIKETIEETLAMIRLEKSSNNIEVIKNYSEDLPKVLADKKQLKQVFMNLIFNSIQAMPEGGTLQISVFHDEIEQAINISLIDSGCGIDEQHISKLFEPFFTTKTQGTGLGLSISRRIIHEHKGKIDIESKKGKGTSVNVCLPVSRSLIA